MIDGYASHRPDGTVRPRLLVSEGDGKLDEARAGRALVTIMETQAAIRVLEPRVQDLRTILNEAIWEAREAGVSVQRLSDLLDVSQSRLYQILDREQERREAEGIVDPPPTPRKRKPAAPTE